MSMNDYNMAGSGGSKNNILGPELGINLLTAYDKYCLYDASMDDYFHIVQESGAIGILDYSITWVSDFGDSTVMAYGFVDGLMY